MNANGDWPGEERESFLSQVLSRLSTLWVTKTYPVAGSHRRLYLHHACEISRRLSGRMWFGDDVAIGGYCSLFAFVEGSNPYGLTIEDRCRIGPRCVLSARNSIHLEANVVIEPDALLMDHAHAYEDISRPILFQGITTGGQIRLGQRCRIRRGAVILCGENRQLTLGADCVVEEGAVVTRSFPAKSIISGYPAKAVGSVGETAKTVLHT